MCVQVLQRFSTIDVVKLSCLVLFNYVSAGVHFSGAAPYFSGKIDPTRLQKWPVRLWDEGQWHSNVLCKLCNAQGPGGKRPL